MTFTMNLRGNSAAFEEDARAETARILRDLAERVEAGRNEGKLYDINGNSVGSFWIKE